MMWSKLKQHPEGRALVAAICVVLLFAGAVSATASSIGAVFALPNARVFSIIGIHSWVPIALALLSYLIYQLFQGRLWQSQHLIRIGVDAAYLALFSVAFYFHFHLKAWVPYINPQRYDDFYWQTDVALQPLTEATLPLRQILSQLPHFDLFYQLGYIALFVLGFLLIAYVDRQRFQQFALAFLLTIILGGLSYLLLPALGPFLYETGLNAEATQAQQGLLEAYEMLSYGGVGWLNPRMGDYFGASLAAMPSLHVAYSFLAVYTLGKIYRNRWIQLPMTLVFLLVICESVWSKWHYWIDAPAGIAVALLGLWLAHKIIGETHGKNQSSKSDS